MVLRNIGSSQTTVGMGRRFSLNLTASPYQEVLSNYQKARYAVFTDLVENSMLDFLVVSDDTPSIEAIYNNYKSENFYIKSRMLSDEKLGAPVR